MRRGGELSEQVSARGVGDRGLTERRRDRRMSAETGSCVCVSEKKRQKREREWGSESCAARQVKQRSSYYIVIIHSSVQCHHQQQMWLSDHHHVPGFDIMSILGELKRKEKGGGSVNSSRADRGA